MILKEDRMIIQRLAMGLKEYVYIATVGKTPEKVLIGLRSRLNIKKVCLVGTSDEEVRQCLKHIEDFSEKLGYVVETVEVDAFDLLNVIDHINGLIQHNKNYAMVINVSAGTRIMTVGALMAAYINNSEAIYVPQQVDGKTPIYIDLPFLDKLLEKVALPKRVLTQREEILSELIKKMKEDYPTFHVETLTQLIEKMRENKFEFSAWDTRFERYPRLIHIHEEAERKMMREEVGPYQLVMHFDARCSRCQSWFTFPLQIGLGYVPTALILGQGEVPPSPEQAPPPFGSAEYAQLLIRSRQDQYCPRCTLLLGLNNVIQKLKQTQMVV